MSGTIEHKGFKIEPFEGTNVGYRGPIVNKSTHTIRLAKRKEAGYMISHPEHLPNGKHHTSLKAAKKYIDEFMGDSQHNEYTQHKVGTEYTYTGKIGSMPAEFRGYHDHAETGKKMARVIVKPKGEMPFETSVHLHELSHSTQHTEEVEQFGEHGKPFQAGKYHPSGTKVKFHDGEHKGRTVELGSSIPKRYSKEETVYRAKIIGGNFASESARNIHATDSHLAKFAHYHTDESQHNEEEPEIELDTILAKGHVSADRARELVANNPELWRR